MGHRESYPDLPTVEIPGGMFPASRKGPAQHGSNVRHRPILQRSEEHMSDDSIDRPGFGKIQDVDEIIPPGVKVQRMLIRGERRGVVTVVLVDGSRFQRSVLKSGEPCLKHEDPARWRKRSVIEGHIEVKGPERENVEYGFLGSSLGRQS